MPRLICAVPTLQRVSRQRLDCQMRAAKSRADDDPLVTQFRELIKRLQEACAPLIVLAQGRRPPKLQVKPESSKSASSQSGSAITASKWFWESSQQASGSTYSDGYGTGFFWLKVKYLETNSSSGPSDFFFSRSSKSQVLSTG